MIEVERHPPVEKMISATRGHRIVRSTTVVVAILLHGGCLSAGDRLAPERGEGNSASALLAVYPADGKIELTYEFDPPVQDFRFRYRADPIRDGGWAVLDPEFELVDSSVRHVSGEMIETVRLEVSVDSRFFDRVFPSLQRAGDTGLVFYTDYLMLEGIPLDALRAAVAPENVIAYSGFSSISDAAETIVHDLPTDSSHGVYFGDPQLIHEFAGGVIVSNAAPSGHLLEQLRRTVSPAVEWLGSFMGTDPADLVFVIATVDETSEDDQWRGDFFLGGEVFLRFFGDGWEEGDIEREQIVAKFLYHELVHLVTRLRVQISDDQPEWLWEGIAEYLALTLASSNADEDASKEYADQVLGRAGRCLSVLDAEGVGISHESMRRGDPPYDCGVLAYWLADGAPASLESADQLRAVWTSAVENLDGEDAGYDVGDLLAGLDRTGRTVEQLLLMTLIDGPDGTRWQDRDQLLSRIGVRVSYEFDGAWEARVLSAVIHHILSLYCTPGRMGFTRFADHVELDTEDRCGPLSGDPLVDTINSLGIFDEIRAVYDSVVRACQLGQSVQFGLFETSGKLTVECAEPIDALPPSAVLSLVDERGMVLDDGADALPRPVYIDDLFRTVNIAEPTNLMSMEGQRHMQALPAVGREDIHSNVDGWLVVAGPCAPADDHGRADLSTIAGLASDTRILIVNEAHDRPHHREFIRRLAMRVAPLGYTHFAAEAFFPTVMESEQPHYALTNYGYYVNEPIFGRLVRTVIELGMKLVPYDQGLSDGEESLEFAERVDRREERQALRLTEVMDSLPDDGRMLIHVGYAHASEVPITRSDGNSIEWMAARLKRRTGIDPLTIDQTDCLSGSPAIELSGIEPWHADGQFDLVVAHPELEFRDSRPTWRIDQGAVKVDVPTGIVSESGRTIVEARYRDDPIDAVPIDRVMVWPGESVPLLLPAGSYSIVGFHEDSDRQPSIFIEVDPHID